MRKDFGRGIKSTDYFCFADGVCRNTQRIEPTIHIPGRRIAAIRDPLASKTDLAMRPLDSGSASLRLLPGDVDGVFDLIAAPLNGSGTVAADGRSEAMERARLMV